MNQQPHLLICARIQLQELLKLAMLLNLQEEFLGKWFKLCNSGGYGELELLLSELYGASETLVLYAKASDEVRALIAQYNVAFNQYLCLMQSIATRALQP